MSLNMSSTQRVRIAVIGTGLIGPRHAQAVLKEPGALLVCIVDPDPAAKDVASSLNLPLYESVREMLASQDKPEAAIICTPNHTHVAVGKELLHGGVHVLVEKPISTDIEGGQELVSRTHEIRDISIYYPLHCSNPSHLSLCSAVTQCHYSSLSN